MLTINTDYPKRPPYPGEYTPIEDKFDKLADELSKIHEGASSPSDNIYETSEYYNIELAAPGLEREDFFVSIYGSGVLSISALHKDLNSYHREIYKRRTFNYECFNREFLLPENIDTDFIKAEYRKGILSFCFLKTAKPYPKNASTIIVY